MKEESLMLLNKQTVIELVIDKKLVCEITGIDFDDDESAELEFHFTNHPFMSHMIYDRAYEVLCARLGNEKYGDNGVIYFESKLDDRWLKLRNRLIISSDLVVRGFSADLRQTVKKDD